MLFVYIVKGVYPFGNSDIAYYDMASCYVPNYARNYEILNGQESLIFSWLSSYGMDTTALYPTYSLHPTNWLLFFIKPDHMLRFMSLFLVIKLVLSSLFISFYLNKTYALNTKMHLSLCMIYTFSGYVVQYYVNIFFLDSLLLFPLIMLTYNYMRDKGNGVPYFLLVSVQLMFSFYLGFMELLYLLFHSFATVCAIKSRKEKIVFSARVGVYTFLSIIFSAITLLPSLIKIFTTKRFSEYTPSLNIILSVGKAIGQFQSQKMFMAFNTEFATALIIIIIFRRIIKKQFISSQLAIRIFSFAITLFPLFNEGTNLLWHMGSYAHFPYRCGYILTFSAIDIISFIWKYETEEPYYLIKNKKGNIFLSLLVILMSVVGIFLLFYLCRTFMKLGIYEDAGSYDFAIPVYIIVLAIYIIVILFWSKKAKEIIFSLISLTSVLLAATGFIAPLEKLHYLISADPLESTIEIRNNGHLENDCLSRVKLIYPALTYNYPLLLGSPSLNHWQTDTSSTFINEIAALGYGSNYTLNHDWGGTIFSDAFFNNKWGIVYGDNYVPDQLYTKYSETNDFTIYTMNYNLPFGMLIGKEILELNSEDSNIETSTTNNLSNIENSENSSEEILKISFDHHVQVANTVAGKNLMRKIPSEDFGYIRPISNDYRYSMSYNLHIEKPSVLYTTIAKYTYLTVNGKKFELPCFVNNKDLPAYDEGLGFMMVGVYEAGEDINITISNQNANLNDNCFALLDLDILQDLCNKYSNSCASSYKAGKNRLEITATVEEGQNYMFLPIEYLEGWKATANGEPVKIHPVLNNAFMALELPVGECNIKMKYMNQNIIKGLFISILGIATIAFILVLKKRNKDICETSLIAYPAYTLLNILAIGGLFVIYIMPILI